jgi:uncharacterized protein (DUF433 family)
MAPKADIFTVRRWIMLKKYDVPVEIVSTPGVQGGKPCYKGTRLPVEVILLALAAGESRQEIFNSYPSLPIGGIEAAVDWEIKQRHAA